MRRVKNGGILTSFSAKQEDRSYGNAILGERGGDVAENYYSQYDITATR